MSDFSSFRRIMIVGGSGAGKSTLARALGERMNLPVIHMDQIFWAPGWVQRQQPEIIHDACAAADAAEWVFEGNHSRSWDYRAGRAEAIIHLDLPRGLRLRRILWRILSSYGRVRPDMAAGCPEQFDWGFLKWSWSFDSHSTPKMRQFLDRWSGECRIVRLTSKREVAAFLQMVSAAD